MVDKVHTCAEQLQATQDGLLNAAEKRAYLLNGEMQKGRTRNVIDLQLYWVLAHSDFELNEMIKKLSMTCREFLVMLDFCPTGH